MNNGLLVSMLDCFAYWKEQLQPLIRIQLLSVTMLGDWYPWHMFHHEVGPSTFSSPRVQDPSDIGVVHQSECLPFCLESGHDVFTGDTGPCTSLEAFALGTDLLVGEMMDVELTMQRVRAANPNMPDDRVAMIRKHLSHHHLSPEQLGELAEAAGADHVVAVHFAPGFVTPQTAPDYAARVASTFSGKVSLGQDLACY